MNKAYILLGIFAFVLILQLTSSVSLAVTNCYSYNTSSQCAAISGCTWKSDQWGSWCQELSCWSLYNQSACTTTAVPGKNCTWTSSATTGWCESPSCWSFSGLNQSACTSNSAGLKCSYKAECTGSGTGSASCWGLTESACGNVTGCSWGSCFEAGCWSYNTSSTCVGQTGNSNKACSWNSQWNYCYEAYCGDNTNQTGCVAAGCKWNNNYCSDISCYNFDYTNQTTCQNNTANLSCTWSSPYCNTAGCWNYNTQSVCQAQTKCLWKTSSSTGWCEELNCWKWDSMNGGNKTRCEANSTLYGLGCTWENKPGGVAGADGWCYKNFTTTTTCANLTTERNCIDSFYCFWNYTGSNCQDPSSVSFNNTVFNDWNPGCYIFDLNSSSCGNVTGCNWTGSACATLNQTVQSEGLSCANINDSTLCASISGLSTCCSWEAGQCKKNQFSTTCFDQKQKPPEGANFCEDYNSFTSETLCKQIANHPWYMPCKWDNSTSRCKFKSDSVFGNNSDTLVLIDNKQACESAGGKWISENYCEGTVSVPAGRCEYKFDGETNCNKACYACEYKSDGSTHNSTTAAKTACLGSKLGFCEFNADSRAPNGFGYCNADAAIGSGREGTCDTDCGACTFYGDPIASDATKKPSYYCQTSKASCKWVADPASPTDESKGVCVTKDTIVCADECDRCTTQDSCVNIGRSNKNSTGSCSWDSSKSTCGKTGQSGETCWDGVDNDNNGFVDCADSTCFTDTICGFVSGSCFGYTTNSTCTSNNCEWVTDSYGAWCDFKGASCWKYGGNESLCRASTLVSNETLNITTARLVGNDVNASKIFNLTNLGTGWVNNSVTVRNATGQIITSGNYTVNYTSFRITFLNTTYLINYHNNITLITYQYNPSGHSCQWSAGSGSGWCEQNWAQNEQCTINKNRTTCEAIGTCRWTNDTWCSGSGNTTDWCRNNGGWCDHVDFVPKNCWKYDGNESACSTNSCSWTTATYAYCSADYSANCWQNSNQSTCNAATNCAWQTSTYGSSWCGNKFDTCSSLSNQSACSVNPNCNWNQWNYCEAKCYQSNITSSACTAISGCKWIGGWCSDAFSGSTCSNLTNSNNQTKCQADSKCKWKNPGWCDPAGFASGAAAGGATSGGTGMTCYKYDSNETGCRNQTGCGWTVEPRPFCSVDWSKDCWQNSDSGSCSANGCYWNPDSFSLNGGWCTNPSDQCWSNSTLQFNQTACNANSYCLWGQYNNCESKCFNQSLTSGTCAAITGCKWTTGWCNAGTMTTQFQNIEAGEPVPLAVDLMNDANPASVDILGVGMKDMGQAFGFGIRVRDFTNSSVCNSEKLSNNAFGTGNETHRLYIYLDTDGSTTGGCTLSHNTSAAGYEFRFRYESRWNSTSKSGTETFNAYKCDTGTWKAADIKISAWKKIMCSDIGGSMIAVEKSDLNKFSALYNASADMRVYASTENQTANSSNPSDTAGPGWTTAGSVDFEIQDISKYGADTAKYEDILKKGFIQYEDCFNGIDDDADGVKDCNDYECGTAAICSGQGVNAAGYVDTTSPQVVGVKIEEYTDAALIGYDTNKPTNGTLEFYYNDSRCSAINTTIYDVGIRSATVRDYKVWHTAEVYNDAGATSLRYSLVNDTTYYYKLKVCDSEGKCAVSKCSSFKTSTPGRCGYCNFVTRIKVPDSWTISYDIDQSGGFEHVQGQVCGPNAGMKTNYTDARKVDIYMYNSGNTTAFWFINSTLTRSALNDKVRTINNESAIKNGTTTNSGGSSIGYAGLVADTRDKIINNLHPEVCRIKIPGTGTCTALWHCGDNLTNCVDRSSAATLIQTGSTFCIWQLPFCEFSVWAGGQPATTTTASSSSSSSSSSGGGGGGGGTKKNATATTTLPAETTIIPEPVTTLPTPTGETTGESPTGAGERGAEGILETSAPLVISVVAAIIAVALGFVYFRSMRKHKKSG